MDAKPGNNGRSVVICTRPLVVTFINFVCSDNEKHVEDFVVLLNTDIAIVAQVL